MTRLLLYNIRYGAGIGGRFHFPLPYSGYLKPVNGNFEKILRYIRSASPDIIGLVEADLGSYRVGRLNQAERIAGELGHEAIYMNKYDSGSVMGRVPLFGKQGNALLTNRAIQQTRFHYFRQGIKRLVIEVELADVVIFLVHLSLKFRHRHYQLHDLHELVTRCDKPVIVAGDFNAIWGQRELRLFLSATGLTSVNDQGIASWPSRSPVLQLDYIFHSPEIRSHGFHMPDIRLSDHMPLLWDFEVEKKRARRHTRRPTAMQHDREPIRKVA